MWNGFISALFIAFNLLKLEIVLFSWENWMFTSISCTTFVCGIQVNENMLNLTIIKITFYKRRFICSLDFWYSSIFWYGSITYIMANIIIPVIIVISYITIYRSIIIFLRFKHLWFYSLLIEFKNFAIFDSALVWHMESILISSCMLKWVFSTEGPHKYQYFAFSNESFIQNFRNSSSINK